MLRMCRKFWKRLSGDEKGQSTTEYILILAVAVMIALKFKGKVMDQVSNATEQLGTNMSKALQDTSQ